MPALPSTTNRIQWRVKVHHASPVTVPTSNGIAFHSGTAVVQGSLHACDQDGYFTYAPPSGTIDVKK